MCPTMSPTGALGPPVTLPGDKLPGDDTGSSHRSLHSGQGHQHGPIAGEWGQGHPLQSPGDRWPPQDATARPPGWGQGGAGVGTKRGHGDSLCQLCPWISSTSHPLVLSLKQVAPGPCMSPHLRARGWQRDRAGGTGAGHPHCHPWVPGSWAGTHITRHLPAARGTLVSLSPLQCRVPTFQEVNGAQTPKQRDRDLCRGRISCGVPRPHTVPSGLSQPCSPRESSEPQPVALWGGTPGVQLGTPVVTLVWGCSPPRDRNTLDMGTFWGLSGTFPKGTVLYS